MLYCSTHTHDGYYNLYPPIGWPGGGTSLKGSGKGAHRLNELRRKQTAPEQQCLARGGAMPKKQERQQILAQGTEQQKRIKNTAGSVAGLDKGLFRVVHTSKYLLPPLHVARKLDHDSIEIRPSLSLCPRTLSTISSGPGSSGSTANAARKDSRRCILAPALESSASRADTTAGTSNAFSCTWKPTRNALSEQCTWWFVDQRHV